MQGFSTNKLADLQQAAFADLSIGDYFIARDYLPSIGAIYLKLQKTGEDRARVVDVSSNRFKPVREYQGITPTDIYFRCDAAAFGGRA